MRLRDTLSLALRRLVERPVRSLLLLQGTVWGVAVAVFPSAVIQGTRDAALTRGRSLGADRIAVVADPTAAGAPPLLAADVEALRADLAAQGLPVDAAGALRLVSLAGEHGKDGALVEADPETPRARGLELAEGRWLAAGDPPDRCVAEPGAGPLLLGRPLRVGDRIPPPGLGAEDGRRLEVVGITRARSAALRATNDLGFDVTHPMFERVGRNLLYALGIPYVEDEWKRSDAVVYTPRSGPEVDWIFLRVDTTSVKRAAERASELLVERGRSPVTLHPLVLPLVMGGEIDRFAAVQAAMFLACLAMGAVVMANLGLLTVLRRSREIAIRRVEGATRRDVALQLLLEGLALTALGAVLGVFLGMGLAALRVSLEPVTGFTFSLPWRDASLAVAVALLVGALASLLPALRAARQSPVEGLVDD